MPLAGEKMYLIRLLPFISLYCLLLAGCADNHLVMNLHSPDPNTSAKVWPTAPETPRYRYVGELTGEDNFQPDNWANRSTASKIIDWIVGLSNFVEDPIVLKRPQSGTVDAEGNIYVTDVGRGGVFVFNKLAGELQVWEFANRSTHFATPIGITLGANNEILVADADLQRVFRFKKDGTPLGDFGHNVLKRPTGLARDSVRGRIYVADTHAHDVKVFNDTGNLITTIGKRGEGDGEFNFPTHLTFAGDRLYVTDTMNSRIQVFNADGKMINKFGKRGLYVGNMVRPKGVAVDSNSNIYVIESLYDNLLVFNQQGRTLLGVGGSGKKIGEFYLPSGVWIDKQDQVYIADMYNGRITVLQFLGAPQ